MQRSLIEEETSKVVFFCHPVTPVKSIALPKKQGTGGISLSLSGNIIHAVIECSSQIAVRMNGKCVTILDY